MFFLTAKITQSLDTTEEILVTIFCLLGGDRGDGETEQGRVNGRSGWCRPSSKRGDGGTVGRTMTVLVLCL